MIRGVSESRRVTAYRSTTAGGEMAYPKIKPCPKCESVEHMDVYTYDRGWRHVECDRCYYLGPGEGSILQAIRAHNAQQDHAKFLQST